MARVKIVVEEADIIMPADLNDTATAKAILAALPLQGHVQTWGEEVYFETRVKMPEQDAHAEVPVGTVAYWSPGHAFCIFFGQEPFSPVNVIGKVDGDATLFARVKSGMRIRVEKAEATHTAKAKK